MELSDFARCVKRKGTFLERFNLNQAGAIGLLVQAVRRLGRTLGAIGCVMMRVKMMAHACGARLRLHMMMNRRRGHAISGAHRGKIGIGPRQRQHKNRDEQLRSHQFEHTHNIVLVQECVPVQRLVGVQAQ